MGRRRMLALGWLCPLGVLASPGLSAQGVELSGGFVLGAPPKVPERDCPLWAEGWTAGTGVDLPLDQGFRLLFEGRYSRISENGVASAAKSLGADLVWKIGGPELLLGLAERRERVKAVQALEQNRAWARVSIRIPGLILPLPGAIPFGVRPFGAENLRTFTRLEFAQALQKIKRGNDWEFSWSLGIRYSGGD